MLIKITRPQLQFVFVKNPFGDNQLLYMCRDTEVTAPFYVTVGSIRQRKSTCAIRYQNHGCWPRRDMIIRKSLYAARRFLVQTTVCDAVKYGVGELRLSASLWSSAEVALYFSNVEPVVISQYYTKQPKRVVK